MTPPIPPSFANAPIPWIVHPQHTGKAPHLRYTFSKRCHRHLSDQPCTLTHKNTFHAPQQQQPTRAQHPPTRRHTVASYRPALPSESRMPDEWGYPSSSMSHVSSAPFSRTHRITHNTLALTDIPRNMRGAAAPTIPTCRYPNCHRPVTRDEITHELTEYCSPEHMRFVVLVLLGLTLFVLLVLNLTRRVYAATLYSVLVIPCAPRVIDVLAALIACSVDLSAKSGQCNSNGNGNNSTSSNYNRNNVSNRNIINDTSSRASAGNRRLWDHPQRTLLPVLSLPHAGHFPPRTEYGSKFDSNNRHVLYRHMQYTLMIDILDGHSLMLDKYNRLTGLLLSCHHIAVPTRVATIEYPAS